MTRKKVTSVAQSTSLVIILQASVKLTARRDSGPSMSAYPSWAATSRAYRIRRHVENRTYIDRSGGIGRTLGEWGGEDVAGVVVFAVDAKDSRPVGHGDAWDLTGH